MEDKKDIKDIKEDLFPEGFLVNQDQQFLF